MSVTNWNYVSPALADCLDQYELKNAVDGLRHLLKVEEWDVDEPSQSAIRDAKITIFRFLLRPNYLASWPQGVADAPKNGVSQLDSDKLDRYKPIAFVLKMSAQHSRSTLAYAFCSLVADNVLEAAIVNCPELPEASESFEHLAYSTRWHARPLLIIPLVRFSRIPTILDILHMHRPCSGRDCLWMWWEKNDALTPAKIRDRWNRLSEAERQRIAPRCFDKVVITQIEKQDAEQSDRKKKKGDSRDIVKKGLLAAQGRKQSPPVARAAAYPVNEFALVEEFLLDGLQNDLCSSGRAGSDSSA